MDETLDRLMDTSFSTVSAEAAHIFETLHFLRGDWFYAFIPLLIYVLLISMKQQNDRSWLPVVDQKLLPYVLSGSKNRRSRYPMLLSLIAASLCITALAGPVYKKLPQPVYRDQSALVILLDLSSSMNTNDIKPSRLARARLELLDILDSRNIGQTALIVYAADAFVVTPLTEDNATIANLVPALETSMMPAQGSNLSIALAKAVSLFTQAGIISGDIVVITDDIRPRFEQTIEKVVSQGHRVSIFGIGTEEGAPIPLPGSTGGGFQLDSDGAIVIPRLDSSRLKRYALLGSGMYIDLAAGDSDTQALSTLLQSGDIDSGQAETEAEEKSRSLNADTWQEEGHWLLLPLLFFAALWARKGWLAVTLPLLVTISLAGGSLLTASPAFANSEDDSDQMISLNMKNLWSSPDQRAMRKFDAGDSEQAAEEFEDPDWKASALYRAGEYEAAASLLQDTDSSDGHYNRGNALARQGKYREAIAAYDTALELNSDNEDAHYNREQVIEALEQQQQENSEQSEEEQDQQEQDQQDSSQDQSQDSENGDSQQDEQQNPDQQNPDQQSPNQQNSEQQQQSEEQELKQRDAEQEKQQEAEQQEEHEKNSKQQDSVEHDDSETEEKPQEIEINPTEASITEEEKATEQWLKRIPDDPGGLLRRKFLYQYNQNTSQTDSDEPW